MKTLRALFLASLVLWQAPALAGTGTVTGKDATGATVTFATTTNAGAANIGQATVCDGTAAAQCAAVKAASTAAIATDPALVVSVSPNNTIAATQSGTWNVGTVTTLTTVTNPIAATQSGTWNIGTVTTITNPVPASQSGNWTMRNVGNAGAILDFAGQNASSPANAFLMGGQFNTTPTTITTGNASPLQLDNAGNLLVNVKAGGASGGTSSNFGSAFPTPGTAVGFTDGTNMVAGRVTTYGTAPTGFNALAVNAFVTNTNANGQTTMSASSPVVLPSDQKMADPCTYQAKTSVNINTATGTTQLVAGVSAKKVYVCSFAVVTPTAVSVSLSEGSAASCATSAQAGVMGVATNGTAANGMAFAANGGLTYGTGHATVAATATAANYLCLFQSGTAQLAGNLTYVQQ